VEIYRVLENGDCALWDIITKGELVVYYPIDDFIFHHSLYSYIHHGNKKQIKQGYKGYTLINGYPSYHTRLSSIFPYPLKPEIEEPRYDFQVPFNKYILNNLKNVYTKYRFQGKYQLEGIRFSIFELRNVIYAIVKVRAPYLASLSRIEQNNVTVLLIDPVTSLEIADTDIDTEIEITAWGF
ncbi:hypothetical protein, partial [Caldisericum sp.]|uniref:hypothetical protein n=1 Tax=Caldisericum sp. TaxID=2499687 RepID=UPI003D0C278F